MCSTDINTNVSNTNIAVMRICAVIANWKRYECTGKDLELQCGISLQNMNHYFLR